MDYVYKFGGHAAAGVLGYIADGPRGVKSHSTFFKPYIDRFATYRNKKQMPPIRKHGKQPYPTPHTPARTIGAARRQSISMASTPSLRRSSLSSRRSSVSTNWSKVSGTESAMSVKVRKRGKAVHKEGVKKHIKVPKKLRKQIKEIMKTRPIGVGRYLDISNITMIPIDSKQSNVEAGFIADGAPSFFSPAYHLMACSSLWNNFGPNTTPNSTAANQFTPRTFKVEVLKQRVTLRLYNNTARNMTINIYACSPKGKQLGGGTGALAYWTNCMLADATGSGAGGTEGDKINVQNITPSTMFVTPKTTPKFKTNYTIDSTQIYLEPGKNYTYTLEGPNQMYDFGKYWSDGIVFDNQQKFIKQIIISMYVDPVTTESGTPAVPGAAGRFTDITDAKYGLIVEQTQYSKYSLPEQAGIIFETAPVAGSAVPLREKKDAYIFKNWTDVASGARVNVVEDQNPQFNAQTGI